MWKRTGWRGLTEQAGRHHCGRRWRILSFLGGEMGGSAEEERGHQQAAWTSEVVGRCQRERLGLGASSHAPYSLKGRTQSNSRHRQVSLSPSWGCAHFTNGDPVTQGSEAACTGRVSAKGPWLSPPAAQSQGSPPGAAAGITAPSLGPSSGPPPSTRWPPLHPLGPLCQAHPEPFKLETNLHVQPLKGIAP